MAISQKAIKEAIIEYRGNVTKVALSFGVTRGAIHKRVRQSLQLKSVLLTARDARIPIPSREPRRVDKTSKCVYLIKEDWRGYTKIGIAKNLKDRIAAMQSGCPQNLSVYAFFEVESPRAHEAQLHKRFAHKRFLGEWFELDQRDLDLIVDYFNAYLVVDDSVFGAVKYEHVDDEYTQVELL